MPEREDDVAGQTALVTGGSRGIGAAMAITLAAAGARVVVNGRDRTALDKVVATIVAAGGTACAMPAALTIEGEVEALRLAAEQAYGPVSLLVACAGGGGRAEPLAQQGLGDWRAVLDTNLTSMFLTLRSFVPPMMAAARGAVVTLSSSAGRQLSGASLPYTAAKAAVQALTRQVAAEAAPHGVRVNAIAPSAIVTGRGGAPPLPGAAGGGGGPPAGGGGRPPRRTASVSMRSHLRRSSPTGWRPCRPRFARKLPPVFRCAASARSAMSPRRRCSCWVGGRTGSPASRSMSQAGGSCSSASSDPGDQLG